MLRPLLCVVLLLLLVQGGVASTPLAWLEGPALVADNRALRLDVQTQGILVRAQIVKLIACSAVDQPLVAYNAENPTGTGCDSPGYSTTQVFPPPPSTSTQVATDVFAARQRARSMYFRRRLLDPHSPSVWLQATLEVRNERGVLIANVVDMVRFQVPERVLAIGQTVPPDKSAHTGVTDDILRFLHLRADADPDAMSITDADPLDYDAMDAREDLNNGTSTRYYNHVHWSTYTALMFGALFAVILLVAGAIRLGRRVSWARKLHNDDDDDDDDNGNAQSAYHARRARQLGHWLQSLDATVLHSERTASADEMV